MIRGHVTSQFSAARDSELSAADAERFRQHLERCESCAREYTVFCRGVAALRAAPQVHMPQRVHIPHVGAPAAVQRTHPSLRRFMPAFGGGATIAALAIAAVLLILGRGGQQSSTSSASGSQMGPLATAPPGACVATVPLLPGGAVAPAQFQHVVTATDGSRPGEELIVATPTASVPRGGNLEIYAVLAAPGSANVPARTASCIRITGITGAAPAVRPGLHPLGQQSDSSLLLLPIPISASPGSVVHIEATVSAGSPLRGARPVTAQLTVTVAG